MTITPFPIQFLELFEKLQLPHLGIRKRCRRLVVAHKTEFSLSILGVIYTHNLLMIDIEGESTSLCFSGHQVKLI